MNEIITIDRNAFSMPIQVETVWKKPWRSKSRLFRLPWEVYHSKDILIIRQHLKLIGTHLQIIEVQNDREVILPLTASFRICTIFFILKGAIKSFGTETENPLLSPCFSLVYFPYGRTDLTLCPGQHNFLILSLEFDWPLSFPDIIGTFLPLMDCWDKIYPSVFVLPFCETPYKLKRILVKMRQIAILNFKDELDLLMYVTTCIKLYHEQFTRREFLKQRELLKIGKRLRTYLQEHYMVDERCKLELVARQMGISIFVLQRSCTIIHGTTFFKFLTNIRIEESCKLLAHGQMDINHIAVEVGYSSPNSFGKSFKRLKGVSPSHFRRNLTDRN